MISDPTSKTDYFIPGYYFFRHRRTMQGIKSLFITALPAVFIALTFDDAVRSFASMILWTVLLYSNPESARTVLHAGLMLHWIAAWTLIVWTAGAWIVHARRVRLSEQPPDTHPPIRGVVFRRMNSVSSRRWTVWGLTAFMLLILLGPLLMPHDPLAQKDLAVTRLMKPLATTHAIRTYNPSPPSGDVPEHFLALQHQLLQPEDGVIYADAIRIINDTIHYRQGTLSKRMPVNAIKNLNGDGSVNTVRAWLGRDQYGRDILSRLITGARISLLISLLSVSLSVLIGLLAGATAGYAGGWIDSLLMRLVDMALAFPVIFLILMIIGLWGPSPGMLILVIGLSGWMGLARLVRGEVLSVKEKEFVLAARALGFGHARILIRHILPNAMTPVIVSATLRIGTVIVIEAGLSFLGLGIQPPAPSWGNMIHDGRAYLTDAWWISVFPGSAIVMTVILFNLLGDGLRDAWDSRFK